MRWIVAIVLGLLIGQALRAERVDQTVKQLGSAASDVVVARIVTVEVSPERDGDWLYDRHVLTGTVESVEKGGLAVGAPVTVRAWRRAWQGGGDPPPASYGIRGIPAPGDVVRVYGVRRADGSIDVVEPNGFAPRDGASIREVTFAGHGGFELRGTMATPAGPAKAPAVLLLPGSGPTDRDGNQKPAMVTDVLAQIAEALFLQGVASMRFDKRACSGYAAAWPREAPAMASFFGYRPFIDDVLAAYRFMRAQPGVDLDRCAILGHSEGGRCALQAAADLAGTSEQPAGVACLATPGRTMDHLIREQIAFDLRVKRAPQEVRDAWLDAVNRSVEMVKAERRAPEDIPAGLKALFNPTTVELLHAYFTVDPRLLAAKVHGPVLVINGDNDIQVSAELDAKPLAAALEAREPRQPSTLMIVEGASHNLKETTSTGDPGFAGPVVPSVIKAIVLWAKELGGAP